MRTLVTGANGLVGHNLVRSLTRNQVHGDNIRLAFHKHGWNTQLDQMEYVFGDLTDAKFAARVMQDVDLVYHCAAASFGAEIMSKDPLALLTPNVLMNTILLDAAYKAGVSKFVWLASTTGYPDAPGEAIKEERMFDGDPYDKYFAVGWSKRFTEKMCEIYATKISRPMTCIVLRPTNIYGPWDKYNFGTCHVLPAMIRKFVEKQNPLQIWGDGSETRDFIYVEDMIRAMQLAANLTDGFTQLNIGSGTQVSINALIDTLQEITGFYPQKEHLGGKPAMIPSREVSIQKAKDELGFSATVSLKDGLNKTIDWYKDEHSNV